MKKYYLLLVLAFPFLMAEAQNFRLKSDCSTIRDFNLTVYPNPTSSSFTIELPVSSTANSQNSQLTIFDMTGREVFSRTMSNDKQLVVDVSFFKSGVYFVQLKDDNGYYNNALLKQ